MMEPIINRDPGDANDHVESGLCSRPWCEDAALPNEEFCRECLLDILAMEAELLGDEAA